MGGGGIGAGVVTQSSIEQQGRGEVQTGNFRVLSLTTSTYTTLFAEFNSSEGERQTYVPNRYSFGGSKVDLGLLMTLSLFFRIIL